MKKKVLATLLTAAMLATTLAGCGGRGGDSYRYLRRSQRHAYGDVDIRGNPRTALRQYG